MNMHLNQAQHASLGKLVAACQTMQNAGDDYQLGARVLGEIEYTETQLLALGLTREQIAGFVNDYFDREAAE